MNKIFTLVLFSLSFIGFSQQNNPSTYYNGFNWTATGTALRNALTTKITTTHTNNLSYAQAENAIKIVDLDPTDLTSTNVYLLYGFSANICPNSTFDDNDHRRRSKNSDGGGATCEWNREHTYAKSLGNPNLGEIGPGADAHHLRSCDVQRNSNRGSLKFAAGIGNSGPVSGGWYPGDEWKGDVARMMMYMYLRYGNQCLATGVGTGTSPASDSNMVNLFLQWNAEDPVSQYEDNRNTYLGNASNSLGQGNRNPFIDNPYLATIIWGGTPATNRWPNVFLGTDSFNLLSEISVYPNPSNDNKINIKTDAILEEINLVNINGQLMQVLKNPTSNNAVYTLENLPRGFYFLQLKSENQSFTKKIIIN